MYSRFILGFLTLFFLINSLFAAEVEIDTQAYIDTTVFTYIFQFNDSEKQSSFSFERPAGSRVVSVIDFDTKEPIDYSFAGDFMILKPDLEPGGENIVVTLRSEDISTEIREKGTFSIYVNFNFDVSKINHEFILEDDLGSFSEIFPRDFTIEKNKKITWEINEVGTDTLFLVNFDNFIGQNSTNDTSNTDFFIVLILAFPILLFVLLLIFIKFFFNNNKKKEKEIEKNKEKTKEEKKVEIKQQKQKEREEKIVLKDDNNFDSYIEKYLTENEKEVVKVIRDNEGIQQYDILNHLPTLTKSNLSKIISKLNSKKVLQRIRVGKINKIYLGHKLKFDDIQTEEK